MTMREDAHAVLTALEHDWADAWQRADVTRCARLLADDFVEINACGHLVSKGEWLAAMATSAPRRIRWEDSRVRLFGRYAVVYTRLHLAGSRKGAEYSAGFLVTDIWTFHGAEWTVFSRQLTRIRAGQATPIDAC